VLPGAVVSGEWKQDAGREDNYQGCWLRKHREEVVRVQQPTGEVTEKRQTPFLSDCDLNLLVY
jgi:hypothetical protein